MSYEIDFAELKSRVSIQQVAVLLGLTLKPDPKHENQWRGRCPRCEKDRVLSINATKGFRCFAGDVKGDIINLVAHIKDVRLKEAAQFIAENTGVYQKAAPVKDVTPEGRPAKPVPDTLAKVRDYLWHEHESVQSLGLDPDTARKLGLGYKPKGVFSGAVVLPLYDREGNLVSYCAFKDGGLKFPPRIAERI